MQPINGISSIISNATNTYNLADIKQATTSSSINKTNDTEAIWKQLGREYDIHNISHDERIELSQKLFDAGLITIADHAILSFNGDRIPTIGNSFLTEPNSSGKFDLIDEFTARIELDKKMQNDENLKNNEHILGILEHIESAGKEPIDIVA